MKNRKRSRSQLKRSAPLPRIQEHAGPASKKPEQQDRPELEASGRQHDLLKPPGDRPPGPPKIDLLIPEKPPPEDSAQLARIDQISMVARTTWFGLLAYLAFVGITLLGVEDADFFVPSRQTQLPLVNVSIPTSSFFWFAPILGAALYAYLHLQLVKLWEALAAPPPKINGKYLSELVYPWLISDYALARRTDEALKPRPLAGLSRIVTWWLVWASAPLVLAGFWWRSMPRHDEWMTLGIAASMMLAAYVGLTSNWRATILLRENGESNARKSPWQGWRRRPVFITLCVFVLALSWARTEGGIDHRFNQIVTLWNAAMRDNPQRQVHRTCPLILDPELYGQDPRMSIQLLPYRYVEYCFFRNGEAMEGAELQEVIVRNLWLVWTLDDLTETFDDLWLGKAIRYVSDWRLFPSAELAGVNLVPNPDNLLDHTTERRRFRQDWCGRQGMDIETCGRLYTTADPAPDHLARRRETWCSTRKIATPEECANYFRKLDGEFREEWDQLWTSRTSALGKLDLSGADLRRANLNGAFAIGVDLTNARMERANLASARMAGAVLRDARMEGAHLRWARMAGADLRWARMEGAFLGEARMEGADLWGARMEGAKLMEARMEGAKLMEARMEGADLYSADLKSALLSETFADTSVRAADLRSDDVTQEILNSVFGDVATIIPDGLVMPDHWDDETLEYPWDPDPKFEAWLRERQAAKKRQATTNDN